MEGVIGNAPEFKSKRGRHYNVTKEKSFQKGFEKVKEKLQKEIKFENKKC